jgi:hypothetical protein
MLGSAANRTRLAILPCNIMLANMLATGERRNLEGESARLHSLLELCGYFFDGAFEYF